jgi:hypothetical protein
MWEAASVSTRPIGRTTMPRMTAILCLQSVGAFLMAITSEPKFGLAVMQALAQSPDGEATVRTLIVDVPKFLNLTADDKKQSATRKHEQIWEQRVRNLKSHDKVPGNVISEGFVEHVGRGRYRLTNAGWLHLQHKGLTKRTAPDILV